MAGPKKQLFGFDAESIADNGRATRAVLGKSRSYAKRFQTANIGGQRSVVVELLEDMAADDTEAKPAKLMTLAGGSWTDTKQRVLIRNVGSVDITAETRCIAWPVANLGLCVNAQQTGVLNPFNLGVMETAAANLRAIQDIDHVIYGNASGTLGSEWICGRLYAAQMAAAVCYDKIRRVGSDPEIAQLTEQTFLLGNEKPINAVCVGAPFERVPFAGFISVYPIAEAGVFTITDLGSASQIATATRLVNSSWCPDPGSDDETDIDAYLAAGGTAICVADIPAVYEPSGYQSLWSGVTTRVAELNAWLSHVGSATRLRRMTEISPKLTLSGGIPFLQPFVACYPLSGVISCNPDTWLGRIGKSPRIVDKSQVIKAAEINNFRAWQSNPSAFYELDGQYSGSYFHEVGFSFGTESTVGLPGATTVRDEFCLSAAAADVFSYTVYGQKFFADKFAYGSATHSRTTQAGSTAAEGIYSFIRLSDFQFQIGNTFKLPSATAESLPGGGKLIVTTRNALPLVLEALQRQHFGTELLNYTTHHKIDEYSGGTTSAGHHHSFGPLSSQRVPLRSFSNLSLTQNIAYPKHYALGVGVESVVPGRIHTVAAPEDPLLTQYLPASEYDPHNWLTVGGGENVWPVVAKETPVDTEYGYCTPDLATRLSLYLEPLDLLAGNLVTLRVRAAACDADGNITASGGGCALTVNMIAGNLPTGTVVATRTENLTGDWQTFEFVLSISEVAAISTRLANSQVQFVPASGGSGAAISWVSLQAGSAEKFPAFIVQMDKRLFHLTGDLAACPYSVNYKGTHPVFGAAGNNFRSFLAYSLDDLTAWGFVAAGLIDPAEFNIYKLTTDAAWYQGFPIQNGGGGCSGIEQDISLIVKQVARIAADVRVTNSGSTISTETYAGFPVVFQNGRFLRPRRWNYKRDYVLEFWNEERAYSSLNDWEDITNWPEESGETVSLQTGPTAPPVCIGFGSEVELVYGMQDPYWHRVDLMSNIPGQVFSGLDFVFSNSNAAVRAAFADGYGGVA